MASLFEFLKTHGDGDAYLEQNPDVKSHKLDPVQHWIDYGLKEGRKFPGIELKRSILKPTSLGHEWCVFDFHREYIALAPSARMDNLIVNLILEQGYLDPAIYAPGALCLPALPSYESSDLLKRNGLNPKNFITFFKKRSRNIFVIPYLQTGGAEKYVSDIIGCFTSKDNESVLIIITDQSEKEAYGWKNISILQNIVNVDVCFWVDLCDGFGKNSPEMFGRFLNASRPKRLIVVNSRLGLDTIVKFGRGLSTFTTITSAFFSAGPKQLGIGAPFGVIYPRSILKFSMAITDNSIMHNWLKSLYGHINGPGIFCIPPCVSIINKEEFKKRVNRRKIKKNATNKKWLWISRIDKYKGISIISELSIMRPNDLFHIYGPLQDNLVADDLTRENFLFFPALNNIINCDFSQYDGFIFTSIFEGMPNIVLELSQHAIPLILAEVGGLRDTFNNDSVFFYKHQNTDIETAKLISNILDKVIDLDPKTLEKYSELAYEQVKKNHSKEVFSSDIENIFSLVNAND